VDEALDLALGGGEDYELLFTAERNIMSHIIDKLEIPIHIIGSIEAGVPGNIRILNSDGSEYKLQTLGWDHFTQ
jgi:thiamine monophosphate kinase